MRPAWSGTVAKTVLVSGGTRGIGAAVSRAFKAEGYKVAANYGGNDEAAENFSKGEGIPVFKWNVADYDRSEKGIAAVAAELGPIEILVNNAGITRDSMLHKMDAEKWNEVIAVDLNSVFNLSRQVIGPMREKGWGRIINISSINGVKGAMGLANYSAAKAGMIGFTKAAALEGAAKGITVNAVAPGYIETEMIAGLPDEVKDKITAQIPAGRFGAAEEVARIVLFLAADEAGFINGATINANGGQYMQ